MLQGCSYFNSIAFFNNTEQRLEICNLNYQTPICYISTPKSLIKITLAGDISTDAWSFSIRKKKKVFYYKFNFSSYTQYASTLYCSKILGHKCDIAMQYEEDSYLYWGGRSEPLPITHLPEQPIGFPIIPFQ